jgi:hypothetical protein
MIEPDRKQFAADPFGYSSLTWQRWGMVQAMAGFPGDPDHRPMSADLKTPILWLTQARALSEAATVLLKTEPAWNDMQLSFRGICDGQFCAAGLMLIGYSLEVCTKAMHIMVKGVVAYSDDEKQFLHHRLEELTEFIPALSAKDRAILGVLTHFVTWAGRYPDPGKKYESSLEEVFKLSETHRITARDMFDLAARVMNHTKVVVGIYKP